MPEALLVDDDVTFLAALSDALVRENFATRTATSLAAARSEIAGSAPDVILVDLNLPDGSGLDLLEAVGSLPATEVVLITGQASVETAVEALRKGAADYLVKPVDLARVKSVLANVSRTRELKRLAAALPWARREPEAGTPMFGRYEVEAEVGEGSMGRVFRCRDPLVGRLVAVKTVKSEYLSGDTRDEYLRRFQREAQAAGMLSHPSIVGIFDVGDDYIVMEFVEGATLHQLLRDEQPLEPAAALRILAPLADALDYAHRAGVIHRDIKPANITVQPDGRPKLMDFGVARMETSTATGSGHVFGSPSYMAPEQILGAPLTPQADLFSFAVVAYEALTGRRPFAGDSVATIVYRVVHEAAPPPCAVNPLLPPACDAVFARALAKDPAHRYPDAATFVAALQGDEEADASAGEPVLASLVAAAAHRESEAGHEVQGTTALAAEAPPSRRWRYLAGLATLVAVLPVLLWARRPSWNVDASWRPLRIETQPPGMPVWIDGLQAGRAPLAQALPPGTHSIRVAEEGYAPAEVTVDLEAGTTAAPLRFVMSRLRVAEASSPAAAEEGARPPTLPAAQRLDERDAAAVRPPSRPDFWTRLAPPPSPAAIPTIALMPRPVREGDLVELTAGVQPPRRIGGDTPRYPEEARRLGLSGSVLIEVLVTERGSPEDVRVLESAGAILDQAVVEAVSGWAFDPAVRHGVKVRVRWTYRHTFTRG